MMKKKVLFICRRNSARSQMAEGIMNAFLGESFEAFSAGVEPDVVHPLAIEVMKEIGIDISSHRSKSIEEFKNVQFDFVVSVCDLQKETCPFFPYGLVFYHKDFLDPASVVGDYETRLNAFRTVRDEIEKFIIETFSEGRRD